MITKRVGYQHWVWDEDSYRTRGKVRLKNEGQIHEFMGVFLKMSEKYQSFLWYKVEIIDRAEHWRIRHLKESVHMLGYNDLLSRPSIDLKKIWESIIKKARWKKKSEYEHR